MDFFEKSTLHKGRFVALPEGKAKGLLEVLKWKSSSRPKPWPRSEKLPDLPRKEWTESTSVTWLGHSTTLIRFGGISILTDPVFSHSVGPTPLLGVKRKIPPPLPADLLPPVDVILISHNHFDHLDAPSLKTIFSLYSPVVVTPINNGTLLKSLGAKEVIELDWWEGFQLNEGLKITVTPALHWSRRTLWDTRKALWGGFVLESESQKVFFAGDTGYHSHFQKIYQKMGPMDLSLLPIGAYSPRWFMKDVHMDPRDAVQAHLDLYSKKSIGIHFGTFQLTDEGIDDPIHDLRTALDQAGVDPVSFVAPSLGQTILF